MSLSFFLALAAAQVSTTTTATTTSTATVTVAPAPAPEWDGALEPSVSEEYALEEVSVHAGRLDPSRVGGSANKVSEAELERFEYDDVQRVLNKVPGVYVREEDGFGLRPNIGLRGGDPNRSQKVTLMEDGILLGPAPYSAPAAYYFPLTTRMSEIQVWKGPAGVRFGPNTIGGAVDMRTPELPRDGEHHGLFDAAYGQYAYGKLHGRYMWGDGERGIMLEAVRLQTDGFKELDGGGNTGFWRNELVVKAEYNTPLSGGVSHRFRIKGSYSDEASNETYLGLNASDFESTPYRRYAASQLDRMEWHRTLGELSHTLEVHERSSLTTTLYRHDISRVWNKVNRMGGADLYDLMNGPDAGRNAVLLATLRGTIDTEDEAGLIYVGPNDRQLYAQGIQSDGRLSLDIGPVLQTVQFGVRYHEDEIQRRHTERAYRMLRGKLVTADDEVLLEAHNRGQASALAVYLLDEVVLYDRLFITPGLRLEWVRTRFDDREPGGAPRVDNETFVLLPGLGLYYQLFESLGVLAGIYRGFSPVGPGVSDAVLPETATNYEAGLRYARAQSRAEVVGFLNDYENLISSCTFSQACDPALVGTGAQFNDGRVLTLGLEATLSHVQPLWTSWSASVDVSYTLTRSEFQASFASPIYRVEVEAGDERPHIPNHQGTLKLGLMSADLGVYAALTYVGEMRDQPGQGEIPEALRIEEAFILDLGADVSLSDEGSVYARIDNALGYDYLAGRQPFGPRPGKPFTFFVGYRHRFGD
jgi:Fe(3+) dicitrate transport protein